MATSALFAVIDALVALFDSNKPTGVIVFDGPDIRSSSALEAIIVGYTGDDVSGDYRSGREEQEWASIGAVSKNARGSVACCVHVQSGGSDVKTLRDRGKVLLDACENALRGDVDLTGGSILFTGLESVELRQQTTDAGVIVRLTFTVSYRARI